MVKLKSNEAKPRREKKMNKNKKKKEA